MFDDAGRAKVILAAAEGQNQHVVVQFPAASDYLAGHLKRCQVDAASCAVDGLELSGDVSEMMRAGVRDVLHLLLVDVPGAGGEGMEHRLPDQDQTCNPTAECAAPVGRSASWTTSP